VVRPGGCGLLDGLVAARRWDIYSDAFEDEGHFARYLDATGGNLDWVAARALGAPEGAEAAVRDAAWAAALARFLVAVPELEARGRVPLVDGRPEAVAALARGGRGALARARGAGDGSARAGHALYAGWQAEAILQRAAASIRARGGGAAGSWAFAQAGVWRVSLTGRW
jgi:phytoene synthase